MFTTANILCFLCGSLSVSLIWVLYLIRIETMNLNLIEAVRYRTRENAYAQGYADGMKAGLKPLAPTR